MLPQSTILTAPFPSIADVKSKPLLLRTFGLYEKDLEVDFNQKCRPCVITQILECCTADRNGNVPSQSYFWNLTVGKRIECLLVISTMGDSTMTLDVKCVNKACQKQMDVTLSIKDVLDLQHKTDDVDKVVIKLDDKKIMIRKPTGSDQLDWSKIPYTDEISVLRTIIQRLILDDDVKILTGELTGHSIDVIGSSMEELDPLINFKAKLVCPYCRKENEYELDLEEHAMIKLWNAQQNLIQSVHRLALKYHWSEHEILSLLPWRRLHYLSLIEEENSL